MKTILGVTLALLSLGASAQSRLGRSTDATFQQLVELTGTQPGAAFGNDVAISGTMMVVAVPLASDVCGSCGAAYVYSAVNGDWSNLTQIATLTQTGARPGSIFGAPVAISGNTIVVGGYDVATSDPAAFVYVNPSGLATQTAELTVSGGGNASQEIFDIGIDGNTVVVGMPLVSLGRNLEQGTAYVYVEPVGGWANMTQAAQLVASDGTGNMGFGGRLAISGRNIVVGATGAKVGGVAYLFVEPAASWSGLQEQTTELTASNVTREGVFGDSVSVSGSTVAVGAPKEAVGSNPSQGAVYIFEKPGTGWPRMMTETAELTAAHGKANSQLGGSVAISGRTAIAGATLQRSRQGAAYVFTQPAGGWGDISGGEQITASDGAIDEYFGSWVAIGDKVVAVSASGWPDGGVDADGAVYVFATGQ